MSRWQSRFDLLHRRRAAAHYGHLLQCARSLQPSVLAERAIGAIARSIDLRARRREMNSSP